MFIFPFASKGKLVEGKGGEISSTNPKEIFSRKKND